MKHSLALKLTLLGTIFAIAGCGNDVQNFECVDTNDKVNIVSFTLRTNSAVFSSVEMRLCKKDGNVSTYSDKQIGCENPLNVMQQGGTILYFDNVVYTLNERFHAGNVAFINTYNCKKSLN